MNTLCVLYFTYVAFYSERNGRKRIVVVAHDSGLTRHRSLKIRAGLRPLFASYKKPSRVNSVQSQLGGQREEDSRDWKENEEERHLPISWTFKTLLVITKFTPPYTSTPSHSTGVTEDKWPASAEDCIHFDSHQTFLDIYVTVCQSPPGVTAFEIILTTTSRRETRLLRLSTTAVHRDELTVSSLTSGLVRTGLYCDARLRSENHGFWVDIAFFSTLAYIVWKHSKYHTHNNTALMNWAWN